MITFQISTVVTDDHRVELTLPPEVPTGRADLVVSISPHSPNGNKSPRIPLADWAEINAEHWGNKLSSADVADFTGRRF